jgi:poly(3-hydroxybutyrate) depolymerase
MLRKISFGVITLSLVFLAASQTTASTSENCPVADVKNWVKGSQDCFALETFMPATAAPSTLVVVLHGDLSRGGPADYAFSIAEDAASEGAIGVAMMRPGYSGGGKTSSGKATLQQDRDNRYNGVENDDIAAAVAALKLKHNVSRVVMFGHSGGAAISGVMAGRAAPLVDGLILLACPCDVPAWRDYNDRRPYLGAESPVDYVQKLPKSTKVIAITGENDSNTQPYLAKDYIERANNAGVDAMYIEVPGAGHNYRRSLMHPYIVEALKAQIIR